MTTRYLTRTELLDVLQGLADQQLDALISAGAVLPVHSESGQRFRDVDVARLRLILDLDDAFSLDTDAMTLVLSLVDQVNGLRGDMQAVLRAVAAEEPSTRARLRQVISETHIRIRTE